MPEYDVEPLILRTHLADRPNTHGLLTGEIASTNFKLEICGPKSTPKGFKPLIQDNAFDVSELSVITYLQAKAHGKPLVLLPAVVLGRFQHVFLAIRSDGLIAAPRDLEGRRVGIRSYTVTTATWARAILQMQYGVDIDRITWVVHESGHVAEFKDPANVKRIELDERTPEEMLISGDVDAVVLGKAPSDPAMCTLFADPQQAARDWYERFGAIQLNHMVVVNSDLSQQRPAVVAEIYDMLKRGAEGAPKSELGINVIPFGVEANRRNLEVAIECAFSQRLIPHRFAVEELFDASTAALN
jgi:4,5-dihydroxyphthalate decarboxylase